MFQYFRFSCGVIATADSFGSHFQSSMVVLAGTGRDKFFFYLIEPIDSRLEYGMRSGNFQYFDIFGLTRHYYFLSAVLHIDVV